MLSCTHCFLLSLFTKLVHSLTYFGHRLYLTLQTLLPATGIWEAREWTLPMISSKESIELFTFLMSFVTRSPASLSRPTLSCSFWLTCCVLHRQTMREQFSLRQLSQLSPRQLPPTWLLHGRRQTLLPIWVGWG